ncbi:hypothetical protein YB2330_005545 [Saitoella coloradoensis]
MIAIQPHPSLVLEWLSRALGWIYFVAWSLSFYPQAILNYRRKSVEGFSLDYGTLNVLGFLCYSIYTLGFLLFPSLSSAEDAPLMRFNDAVFALHALALSSFTIFQAYGLGYRRAHNQSVSPAAIGIFAGAVISCGLLLLRAMWMPKEDTDAWVDVLFGMSYVKVIVTMFKYAPQALLNYHLKSTRGFSIHQITLDITGGLLSNAQLFLDAYMAGDMSNVTGNPAKFGLGVLSIGYNLVFLWQHYGLYWRERQEKGTGEDELA